MATKKKTAPKKSKPAKLIVLVPSKWKLDDPDIQKLREHLQTEANSTIIKFRGAICVATIVINGNGEHKK